MQNMFSIIQPWLQAKSRARTQPTPPKCINLKRFAGHVRFSYYPPTVFGARLPKGDATTVKAIYPATSTEHVSSCMSSTSFTVHVTSKAWVATATGVSCPLRNLYSAIQYSSRHGARGSVEPCSVPFVLQFHAYKSA
jgi:hypothetical protein